MLLFIAQRSPLITQMLASLTWKWVFDIITHVTLNTTNDVIVNFGVYIPKKFDFID